MAITRDNTKEELEFLKEKTFKLKEELGNLKWWNFIKKSVLKGEILYYEQLIYEGEELIAQYDKDRRLQYTYQSLKWSFRRFFEGWDDVMENFGSGHGIDPIVDIPIHKFGITDISFNETEELTEMNITLERPGILIGKAGRVINELQEYLTKHHERPVKILIIESKLWR